MKKEFVVDNSVVMSWLFEDESTEYTESILSAKEDFAAHVPAIWPLEVVNVLASAERRRRVTGSDSMRFLTLLESLPISVSLDSEKCGMRVLLPLCRDFGLTSYDASYLLLAMSLGIPIATVDKALTAAAKKAGLKIFLR